MMHEHVTWEMIGKWIKAQPKVGGRQSQVLGKLIIEVDEGMIGLKNPKTGVLQLVSPKDFGIEKLSADAEIIAHKNDEGDYLVYVLNPGSEKFVVLELILEKEAFGVYSKEHALGAKLSSRNYAVIDRETAAICTPKVLFVVRGGKHVGITLEKAGVKSITKPVFGVGESESHVWLAVMQKGGDEAILVCLTDSDLGYAVRRKSRNALKDKELLEEE